jgi:hypothetical protein
MGTVVLDASVVIGHRTDRPRLDDDNLDQIAPGWFSRWD